MAIIQQLKNLNAVFGFMNGIAHSLGVTPKQLTEMVSVVLPAWDPPEPRPPEPPDEALVARVQEAQGMAALQEQRAFEKAMQTEAHKATVDKDMAESQRIGVRGTPSFFVNGTHVGGKGLNSGSRVQTFTISNVPSKPSTMAVQLSTQSPSLR